MSERKNSVGANNFRRSVSAQIKDLTPHSTWRVLTFPTESILNKASDSLVVESLPPDGYRLRFRIFAFGGIWPSRKKGGAKASINPNPGNLPGFQQNTQPIDARILSVAWLEGKPALGMGYTMGTEQYDISSVGRGCL